MNTRLSLPPQKSTLLPKGKPSSSKRLRNEKSASRWWRYLSVKERSVRLFMGGILILLFTMIIKGGATPVYVAEAILLIKPHVLHENDKQAGGSLEQEAYDYKTQYELLKGRGLVGRVLHRLGDQGAELFNDEGWREWLPWPPSQKIESGSFHNEDARAIELYLRNLEISPIAGTRLVKIAFCAADPEIAARVANTHAEEYIKQTIGLRTELLGASLVDQQESSMEITKSSSRKQGLGSGKSSLLPKREVSTTKQQADNGMVQPVALPLDAVITDRALPPARPMQSRLFVFGVAGLLVMMTSVGISIWFGKYLDPILRTPADVSQHLQLVTLGVIPDFSNKKLRSETSKPLPPELSRLPGVFSKELFLAYHPLSVVPEAYRSLRAELLLTRPSEPPRSVLFVSGGSSEGKTVTTLNTAIALAQMGARVLVVDADLRHPHCHTVLRAPRSFGLTEFLTGQRDLAEVIQTTRIERLFFVSGGAVPPNPAELLGSKRMRAALLFLYNLYDYVLIDSPPLGVVSDALVLSAMIDGVVLVVNSQQTHVRTVQESCARLDHVRATILGVVLNKVDLRSGEYAKYYERYQAYYQQAAGDKQEPLMVMPGEAIDISSDVSSEQKKKIRKVIKRAEQPDKHRAVESPRGQPVYEKDEKKENALQKKEVQASQENASSLQQFEHNLRAKTNQSADFSVTTRSVGRDKKLREAENQRGGEAKETVERLPNGAVGV